MAIEINSEKAICTKCGIAYSRRKGYFPVSYAVLYKGIGYMPICKTCIDDMYNGYLSQCGSAKDAVRQMCRKLDLFWSEKIYEQVEKKSSPRSMMTQYIAKINTVTYAGKCYDNTLSEEGSLWSFEYRPADSIQQDTDNEVTNAEADTETTDDYQITDEMITRWGSGLDPDNYKELEARWNYWSGAFPGGFPDRSTEALICQICSLEIDINRARASGKAVDKMIQTLNVLLGSANLKPVQKKQDEMDSALSSTPLGVWLYRYENKRPLPEIDDQLKDVNGIRKYVFTWMGHLCKMLGLKNAYSQLYEAEVNRLRVERPEYDGDDDETFMNEIMSEADSPSSDGNAGETDEQI